MRNVVVLDRVDSSDLEVLRAALELLDERSEVRAVLSEVVATLGRGVGVVMILSPPIEHPR